ncbi:unnamed protein product [Mytilus coruscus]|uniref:Reverse transcriptase domain-containing protein n=1 Tax=Mytilus coruscus TaxID=42192 RepID=A0A6J8B543_MYTCO|nr:unnamed protein product [Mytilus coruscus]
MTKNMVENSYIDTSMQKGGIAGFSGCVEHTSVFSQLIHEAKTGKKNLAVVWLDLANAYGSVPHKLIEMAMDHYHIPEHIKKIVQKYFGGIQLQFTVDHSVAEVRERNIYGLYHLTDTIHYEYEYHHEGSKKEKQEVQRQIQGFFTSNKRVHG